MTAKTLFISDSLDVSEMLPAYIMQSASLDFSATCFQ